MMYGLIIALEKKVVHITGLLDKGPGAIIVVDLSNGGSFRHLNGNSSICEDLDFISKVEAKVSA